MEPPRAWIRDTSVIESGRTCAVDPWMRCSTPPGIPITSQPESTASIVAAEMTELIPGAGPPPHRIPSLGLRSPMGGSRPALHQRLRLAQALDFRVTVPAHVAQDLIRVGTEAGRHAAYPAVAFGHAPRDADVLAGADDGVRQLDEEAARVQVRVLGQVAVGGGGEGGDAGGLESHGRLLGNTRAGPRGHDLFQRVLALLARGGGGVTRVARQLGMADRGREARPGRIVLDRDRDPAVLAGGAEDAVRRHVRVAVAVALGRGAVHRGPLGDRKSTRLNSSHSQISYAVFCLKKKKISKIDMRVTHDVTHNALNLCAGSCTLRIHLHPTTSTLPTVTYFE